MTGPDASLHGGMPGAAGETRINSGSALWFQTRTRRTLSARRGRRNAQRHAGPSAQRRGPCNDVWNNASSRNVGGHWPTKVLQSRLPASQSVADTAMEAIAAQYQVACGTLSVTVKYSFWTASISDVFTQFCFRGGQRASRCELVKLSPAARVVMGEGWSGSVSGGTAPRRSPPGTAAAARYRSRG